MTTTATAMLAVLLSLSLPLGSTVGGALAFGALVFGTSQARSEPMGTMAPATVSVCKNGETKKADDGCNTCSCHGGQWACTEKGCSRVNRP